MEPFHKRSQEHEPLGGHCMKHLAPGPRALSTRWWAKGRLRQLIRRVPVLFCDLMMEVIQSMAFVSLSKTVLVQLGVTVNDRGGTCCGRVLKQNGLGGRKDVSVRR
jgi:hypothetical protein